MEGWKCGEVTAAAATLKIPQRPALILSAFDNWQVAIIVGDCPSCVVCLNRFGWPSIRLVSFGYLQMVLVRNTYL